MSTVNKNENIIDIIKNIDDQLTQVTTNEAYKDLNLQYKEHSNKIQETLSVIKKILNDPHSDILLNKIQTKMDEFNKNNDSLIKTIINNPHEYVTFIHNFLSMIIIEHTNNRL